MSDITHQGYCIITPHAPQTGQAPTLTKTALWRIKVNVGLHSNDVPSHLILPFPLLLPPDHPPSPTCPPVSGRPRTLDCPKKPCGLRRTTLTTLGTWERKRSRVSASGAWWLVVGDWRLVVGVLRLESGLLRLEIGDWVVEGCVPLLARMFPWGIHVN